MMTTPLQLTFVYADESLGTALAKQTVPLPADVAQPTIDPPVRTPGAMGGWFELAATFGVLSLPAGVLASCIATWITSAIKHRNKPETSLPTAKLVFERGGRSVEIEVTAADPAALVAAIQSALDDVDPE
jgi:tRNA threonylcarbamoyladenosine modification (KEOPS) complex  Pcc1 subunit